MDKGSEVVHINDLLGNLTDGDPHIFIATHSIVEVEIFDVNAHESGSRSGNSAVDENFGSG